MKQIRQFVITSPCYRNNGYNGTYVSYAETDANGNFLLIEGDHNYYNSEGIVAIKTRNGLKTNIFEIVGNDFSDEFRPISIKEVEFDASEIYNRIEQAPRLHAAQKDWEAKKEATIPLPAKITNEYVAQYDEYRANNPYPVADFISYPDMCKLLLNL